MVLDLLLVGCERDQRSLSVRGRFSGWCKAFSQTAHSLTFRRQAPKDGLSQMHDPPDSFESKYIGGTIQEVPDKVARANPITYISADEKPPPFFLAHGKSTGFAPFSPPPSPGPTLFKSPQFSVSLAGL